MTTTLKVFPLKTYYCTVQYIIVLSCLIILATKLAPLKIFYCITISAQQYTGKYSHVHDNGGNILNLLSLSYMSLSSQSVSILLGAN